MTESRIAALLAAAIVGAIASTNLSAQQVSIPQTASQVPYDNKRNETMYFYTDNDTQLKQLVGESSYAVTFPKGQLPPVSRLQ